MEGQRAIVSVSRVDETAVRDVELPVDLPIRSLCSLLAYFLGWPPASEVALHPSGRLLNPDATLAEEGVWDGAWLVVRCGGSASSTISATPAPFVRWRPITAESGSGATTLRTGTDGFAWKRVDPE